jgi:Cft2 family RNA processing exonuclease
MLSGDLVLSLPGLKLALDHAGSVSMGRRAGGSKTAGLHENSSAAAGIDACYVSHAHSDHTAGVKSGKPLLASKETLALCKKSAEVGITHEKISLSPAGHMLGATQLLAQCDGYSLAYTGDFSMEGGLTYKGCKPLQCEVLVTETTYCDPQRSLPTKEEVFTNMERWLDENIESNAIILGGYSTGKAEELVKFLNKYCSITPIVSKSVDSVCKIYNSLGCDLKYVPAGTPEAAEMMSEPFVAVMPFHQVNRRMAAEIGEANNMNVLCALATGWAGVHDYNADAVFPLSDHADFDDIVRYAQESGAKTVLCALGENEKAAAHLRKVGINAMPAEKGVMLQQTLA